MRIVTIPRSWDPEVRRCGSRGKEAEALAGLIGPGSGDDHDCMMCVCGVRGVEVRVGVGCELLMGVW